MKTAVREAVIRLFLAQCLTVFAASASDFPLPSETRAVDDTPGYNCWPMIESVGKRLVNVYTVGAAHEPAEKGRATVARYSDDGGKTWSERREIFRDLRCGTSSIGKGHDENGAALFWVRRLGIEPRMALYRTTDGENFELVSAPTMSPNAMQITDIFRTPEGLMCLWFSDDYSRAPKNKCWGTMLSRDNGRTWSQAVVEKDLAYADWPTEQSIAVLGDGRLLGIARREGGRGSQFQLMSKDWGRTWFRRVTNIGDVLESTPSVIYEKDEGVLYNYYFQRGAGVLKVRTAKVEKAWENSQAWGEPLIIAYGEKERPCDSGNANAVAFGGSHLITYYAGNPTNCRVLVTDYSPKTKENNR